MQIMKYLEVPETRHLRWTADIALPVIMWAVFALPMAALPATSSVDRLQAFLASTLFIVPLVLRRRYPLLMLALMTLAGLYTVVVLSFPVPAIAAVPFAIYSVARWVRGPVARVSVVIGGVASIIGPARWTILTGSSSIGLIIGFGLTAAICIGLVLSPYVVGRRVQETALARKAEQDAVTDRYQRMLHAREQTARMAETRARTEIARELHDIVAHSLSVMIVQAEGGKALAAKRPEKSEEVLGTIAEIGREALGEMRRIVGVLRADTAPAADYTPTPGLADVPEMLAKAGDRVHYRPPAWVPPVPTTLGLTVFRVVQESITNFLKYAGPDATATVSIHCTPRFMRVEISDDGIGSAAPSDGAGSGVKGMRERVTTMGGQLVAGPRPGGGFEVVALLPLAVSAQPPTRVALR